ncbi:hypothetical protein [Streptomyces sp. NPDC047108]|uniref:hypothetical protein n=1 Tax=Streptomyces sp. NPDC047108 TaxID=3155025 RepID=UPI0033CCE337
MAGREAVTAAGTLAVLRTLLVAALLFSLVAATPLETAELRADGAPNGVASPAAGPVWDDPDPPDGPPYSHRHGTRSHHRPADHPVPTGSRVLHALDRDGGSAVVRHLPRPTAHGPPRARPAPRPAARPAVLQVFRL